MNIFWLLSCGLPHSTHKKISKQVSRSSKTRDIPEKTEKHIFDQTILFIFVLKVCYLDPKGQILLFQQSYIEAKNEHSV